MKNFAKKLLAAFSFLVLISSVFTESVNFEIVSAEILILSLLFDIDIELAFIGANINRPKIQLKVTEVKIQRFDFLSFSKSFQSQINNPTAMIFLIMASIGVIGINSPKQPQFPEFPPLKKVT